MLVHFHKITCSRSARSSSSRLRCSSRAFRRCVVASEGACCGGNPCGRVASSSRRNSAFSCANISAAASRASNSLASFKHLRSLNSVQKEAVCNGAVDPGVHAWCDCAVSGKKRSYPQVTCSMTSLLICKPEVSFPMSPQGRLTIK